MAINMVFFQKRYMPLDRNIHLISAQQKLWNKLSKQIIFREHFKNNLRIDSWSIEHGLLLDTQIIGNISKIDDKYFYFEKIWHSVFVLDITKQIDSQIDLLYITLYGILTFVLLAYILSLYFVKASLNKLNWLVKYMQNLNLENIHKKFEITWHPDDEINILANRINDALDKIHIQTLSLKDFISNASHELKTPLMAINSEIDYAIKSKNHKWWLLNIKWELKNFNNLLDELVLITKFNSNISLDKKTKNISNIINKNLKNISNKFKNKKIKTIQNVDNNIKQKIHNSSFDIISKNLIENAFKYTDSGSIEIILNNNEFVIKDTGIWIEKRNLSKIWDRFWQEDSSKTETWSFGLWLYLTKLLVKSTKGKWSEFKIIF